MLTTRNYKCILRSISKEVTANNYKMGRVKTMEETKMELSAVVTDWLDRMESDNSKVSYFKTLDTFAKMTFEINVLPEMNIKHWIGLDPSDVRSKFVNPLQREGLKNSTIKYYIRVVRSFVTHMERYKYFSQNIDLSYIKVSCLETRNISDDTVSRAKLGASEFYEFIEWLKNERFVGRNKDLGYKYALAAEFMFKTASRLTAVFKKVRWADIVWEGDSYHNFGWNAYILDKGNKVNKKAIPASLYDAIHKEFYNGDRTEPIFKGISSQMFSRLTNEYGAKVGREYVPHSIKVGAGTEFYNRTHDLVRTMEFLDHEDPKTTLEYIRLSDDRTKQGGYVLSLDVDKTKLEDLSKEQLLSIIKSDNAMAMAVATEAENRHYAEGIIKEQ